MSYQLKRLDLLRSGSPVLVGVAVAGLVLALIGVKIAKLPVMGLGGVLYSIAILLMAKPVLSVMLGILGVAGGVLTFFVMPNPEMAVTPVTTRLLATTLFSVLYLALMDTLLLIGAFLYNLLVQTVGLGGIRLEIAEEAAPGEEA